MDKIEIWKDIPNYEGKFMVSTYGRVWSYPSKRYREGVYRALNMKEGYLRVTLNKWAATIHRLVALTFIPNPDNKKTVNHKDCNKLNNYVDNLEWATNEENLKHAWINNLFSSPKGSDSPNSKLDELQVSVIKSLMKSGELHKHKIASYFNISVCTVNDIISGRSWRHVL